METPKSIKEENPKEVHESKKYSREEVEELLLKHTSDLISGKRQSLDEWIEDNL